jgi:hypothetical protein
MIFFDYLLNRLRLKDESDGGGGGGGTVVLTALPFSADHSDATGNPYLIGDLVWYRGQIYVCIANNDSIPPTDASYWRSLGVGYSLKEQPVDWNSTDGNNQVFNKPYIPDERLISQIVADITDLWQNKRDVTAQKNSIQDDGGYIQLVADEELPDPNKVYSTDAFGNKGWHFLNSLNTGLFAQTTDGQIIANTTVAGELIGAGVGSLYVRADGFKVGDSFEAILSGILSTQNGHLLKINITSGTQLLASSGEMSMSHATNGTFQIRMSFTINELGVSGKISCFGSILYTDNQGQLKGMMFSSVEALDTTIPNTLSITAQWGQTEIHDSIQCKNFTLHRTY